MDRMIVDCGSKNGSFDIEEWLSRFERICPGSDEHILRPPHYTAGRSIEPIDAIVDWELDFCLGNVVKYVTRAGRKGPPVEDLKKAAFYLQREIELLEGGEK